MSGFIGFQRLGPFAYMPDQQQIGMPEHTLRIARLKMRHVAAQIIFHGNRDDWTLCFFRHPSFSGG